MCAQALFWVICIYSSLTIRCSSSYQTSSTAHIRSSWGPDSKHPSQYIKVKLYRFVSRFICNHLEQLMLLHGTPRIPAMMTMLKHKKRHTPHFWHVCSCEQTKTTRAHQIATHVEQIKKDNVNTRMFTVTALSPPQHPYHNQVPGTIWYLDIKK